SVVDRMGIAVAWGKADLVLPSLWQEIAGRNADWAVRDADGKALEFTPKFRRLWVWKDELPERRLACAGRHLGGAAFGIWPRVVAPAYALTGRSGDEADFRDESESLGRGVARAGLEKGPLTS